MLLVSVIVLSSKKVHSLLQKYDACYAAAGQLQDNGLVQEDSGRIPGDVCSWEAARFENSFMNYEQQ